MTRAQPTAVKEILGENYPSSNPSLSRFITAANVLANFVDECSDGAHSEEILTIIEEWLAAHFYAISDPIAVSKSTGRSSGSFSKQAGQGLKATWFGEQAIILDTSGCLAKRDDELTSGGKKKVVMHWLGKPPSEQIPYSQRD